MTEAFDPYHRWLGISPKHRPPDHYRLLGLERGESDPEVIRDAAERQMGHVRQYQLGPNAELSQRILNELAAAKGCLLDAERRAAYDAQLSLETAGRQEPSAAEADSPLAVELPAPATAPPPLPVVFEPVKKPLAERPSPVLLWSGAAAACLVLAVVVAVTVFVVERRGSSPEVAAPAPPPAPVTVVPPVEPVQPVEPAPVEKSQPQPDPWTSVGEQVARALVRLEMITADGHASQGLGLVTDPKGILITSAEPAGNCQSATAFFANGTFQSVQAPVAVDRRLGLAAFRIQPVPIEPVTFCRLVPVPGPPLAVFRGGGPVPRETSVLAMKRTVPRAQALTRLGKPADVAVASQFGLDATAWLDLEGSLVQEDCGAPVFNLRAQLVGLLVWNDAMRKSHFAVPTAEIDGFLGRIPDTVVALPAPQIPTSPKPPETAFPSGRAFSDSFIRQASTPAMPNTAESAREVVEVGAVGSFLKGLVRPGLVGSAVLFFDRKATQPAMSLEYRNQQRSGLVQTWNPEGQRVYCCQYADAKRDGFCCLLEKGEPRLALEYRNQQCQGVLLLAGGKTEKSFADLSAARADSVAGPKLTELDKIEAEVDRIEPLLMRKFKEELEDREELARRKKTAEYTRRARERINQRIEQHSRENAAALKALQRKAMGK